MAKSRALVVALLPLALAACTVGPDYVKPSAPSQAIFAHAADLDALPPGNPPVSGVNTVGDEFWRALGDPQLSALVDTALASNHDLRIALAHYDRANALLRDAKFDQFPTITASANGENGRLSTDQALGAPGDARDAKSYSAGINASWELDLFGRIRRSVEAGRADVAANAADLRAAQVAIVGQVATTYVQLRGLQERLRVAHDNVDNQRETLQLVETRLQAGQGSEFDTSRARAQLETTASRIPALEAQIAFAMHRLAVLTGRTPDALINQLTAQKPLPLLPGKLDPGTPGELLRRRPDVAAAEARLHGATAHIGVATADLFPRFTLSGLLGSQAIDSSALFRSDSETRLVALGVDWSFLDIGRVRARIAASDADAAAALASYQQTVLLALEDTENALVRYARARSEDEHLERAASESERAAQLARIRFDAGAVDLLDVLDAQRTLLLAQEASADSRTRSITSAVALYEAMAGGWPESLPVRSTVGSR